MTTSSTTRRRILPLTLLAVATTLALTACDGPNGAGANTAASGTGASPSSSAGAPAGTSAAPQPSAPTGAGGSGSGSGKGASHGPTSGSTGGSSDTYANSHPCAGNQLTVKAVYDARLGATKRLVEVTNTGSADCGLSHYPLVAINKSSTLRVGNGEARTVQPSVPGGLGGAPYHPLHAGRTAYAVVDLDPSHSTAGGSREYDQLSIIASSNLPNAYEVDTKITEEGGSAGNPYVKSPFLGLYRDTIADAVTSATPTNR